MKFPCTSCGACCAKVSGPYTEWLPALGYPIRADGSCSNYDRWTKECMIYETRPDICRVEKICPTGMSMQEHFDKVEQHCDRAHLQVYGSHRERGIDCDHDRAELRLQLETISVCNAACHFCPYIVQEMRRGNIMDMGLFKKIVDEAAGIPSICIYSLQGLGEPLLDKHIIERIAYIKEKDPNSKIEMFTNGVLATDARLYQLEKSGIDCLVFSLNAVRPEQHEEVMKVKGKFEQVCRSIEHAMGLGIDVRVHAVEDGKLFTPEDSQILKQRWGDACKPVGVGNWAGDLNFNYSDFTPNKCCFRALTTIYVMYNGQCTMCCFDPVGDGAIFGDLNNETLREVYASPKYVQFREDHFNDKADKYERCAGCSRI